MNGILSKACLLTSKIDFGMMGPGLFMFKQVQRINLHINSSESTEPLDGRTSCP